MSGQPNVLFLVHRVPFPPNRGDRIRSYQILRFLAARANVYLGTLTDEPLDSSTAEGLAPLCKEYCVARLGGSRWLHGAASLLRGSSATEGLFASAELRRKVQTWTRSTSFDAVVVFCSSMVQYANVAGLEDVPTIVDLVDVDSQKFFDYAQSGPGLKRLLYRLEGTRLRKLECTLPAKARAITLVSEAEANIFRSFCANDRTRAITNGVDLDFFRSRESGVVADHCVFVGAMDYPPNIDGVTWFCRDIWPTILAQRPQATFTIVGRNPPDAVQRLAELPGVSVTGTVSDVRPFLEKAAVVVAPLRIARGVQNKVLEAMAMARPVVTTPQALEGIQATAGEHLLCAEGVSQWTETLLRLLGDTVLQKQLSRSARAFVEARHDWSTCLDPLGDLLFEQRGALPSQKLVPCS